MTAHAAVVGELLEVLDRFAEISDGATRACAIPDLPTIERALEARQVVLARAQELAPVLQNAPLPAAVRSRLERLERADRALTEALARAKDETRAQLNENGAQTTRVGGYAATMPRFRQLDIRR
jgi:hypothetical protein